MASPATPSGDAAPAARAAHDSRTSSPATEPAGPGRRQPRGPRWERRKDQRPSELLDAALALFVERGYATTRLEDVAARAGVSKGTLYLYYTNKEELLKAVVNTSIVPLIAQSRADIEQDRGTTGELLTRFLETWWLRFGGTRLAGIMKLVVAEAGNFPDVARFFNDEVVTPHMQLVESVLARGVASGELHCPNLPAAVHSIMAPLVLKAIWANSIENCCGPGKVEPLLFIRHHLDLVLRAMRNPSAAP